MCVSCGYNTRTGRATQAATGLDTRRTAKEVAARLAVSAGTFVLGCILCTVGALIGAVIWCAVAVTTHYEIGWIAWGLGVLAGAGMTLGYRQKNIKAGVLAAVIALFGIGAAKVMIILYFARPVIAQVQQQVAVQDTRGSDIERLSLHKASLEAKARGTQPGLLTLRQLGIANETYESYLAMTAEEIDADVAALDAWEAGGKWHDEPYVRNELVYEWLDDEAAAYMGSEEAGRAYMANMDNDGWKGLYGATTERVDAMTHDERVAALKAVQDAADLDVIRSRVAYHRAGRKADAAGLAPWAHERETFYEQEEAVLASLSIDEARKLDAELDAWEKSGRFESEDYTRRFLIAHFAGQSLTEAYEQHLAAEESRKASANSNGNESESGAAAASDDGGDDDYEFEYEPDEYFLDESWSTPQRWQEHYAAAAARVDVIPPAERAQRIRDIEAQEAKELEKARRQWEEEQQGAEMEAAVEELASRSVSVFKAMFGPIDFVFGLLALISAYGIAARGAD